MERRGLATVLIRKVQEVAVKELGHQVCFSCNSRHMICRISRVCNLHAAQVLLNMAVVECCQEEYQEAAQTRDCWAKGAAGPDFVRLLQKAKQPPAISNSDMFKHVYETHVSIN